MFWVVAGPTTKEIAASWAIASMQSACGELHAQAGGDLIWLSKKNKYKPGQEAEELSGAKPVLIGSPAQK
jgi:hypothetical protein